jgi:hypothetical protein
VFHHFTLERRLRVVFLFLPSPASGGSNPGRARKGLPYGEAIRRLNEAIGTQFDTFVVHIFISFAQAEMSTVFAAPALPFPRHSSDVAQAPASDAWFQVFTLGGFPYFPAYDFPPFWFYLSTYRILCTQGSLAFAQSSPLHKKKRLICETNNVFLRHEGQAKLRKRERGTLFTSRY